MGQSPQQSAQTKGKHMDSELWTDQDVVVNDVWEPAFKGKLVF